MPVTMQQVLAEIDKDEPDYSAFPGLGPDALPHLRQLVEAQDPLRAAKAAYAASLIPGSASAEVLSKAADHPDPQVRVAVAHGLKNPAAADAASNEVLAQLLDDTDSGVRKLALSTAGDLASPELRAKVAAMAEGDDADFVREAASEVVGKQK